MVAHSMEGKHTDTPARRPARGYFSLIAAGEPFRLLFPMGAAIGIFGVALWPLYVWHITRVYPGAAHPRIMVEGFLTCFVVGFLGTALPRLLDVPRINICETSGFAIALSGVAWLHYKGNTLWGDELFFFTLAAFVASLAARAILGRDIPPPAFVLVLMGILSALTGSGIMVVAGIFPELPPPWAQALGRLLLNQGYLLLPVMGIGAFLLPRFFGIANQQNLSESQAQPSKWSGRAGFAFLCGITIIASFVLEAMGCARWGCAVRGVVVAFFFFREVPAHRAGYRGGSLAMALRIAMPAIPCGYLLMAVQPKQISSFLHVVFITEFSLMTFTVASRVVLGHSGQSEKFRASLQSMVWLAALVTLAMLARVTADWMPATRMDHYAYAAVVWITGVLIWAVAILPGVRVADVEPE